MTAGQASCLSSKLGQGRKNRSSRNCGRGRETAASKQPEHFSDSSQLTFATVCVVRPDRSLFAGRSSALQSVSVVLRWSLPVLLASPLAAVLSAPVPEPCDAL